MSLREKTMSVYIMADRLFVMPYVPLELLVFFMGSSDRVNKADRLGEIYLAFMSFVSSHFCCSQCLFSFILQLGKEAAKCDCETTTCNTQG